MKKRHYLLLLGLAFLASACLSTLELKLYSPQEVTLPFHLKHLGILDHSQGFDPNQPDDNPFLKIELPKEYNDQIDSSYFSYAAIVGADMQAVAADSLETTKIQMQLRRALPDSFPPALPQEIVEQLCKRNGLDGLLVLEYFKVEFENMPREFGVEPSNKGKLTVGWRVYDAKNASVIFEDIFLQELPYLNNFNLNRPDKNGRKTKRMATIQMAASAGNTIIKILARTHILGNRRIYAGKFGPTDEIAMNMKKAGELAKEGKWEAAMNLWNPVASHTGYGKSCGKAALNMAVGCEHLGNLPLAIRWVKIARSQGLEEVIPYQEFLRDRMREFQ
ncbi:MAG: DUF6340 family protein [Bacteroidota bacterium]